MCSNCVHDMTCIEYRHAHTVVSRYPANLASRQTECGEVMRLDCTLRVF